MTEPLEPLSASFPATREALHRVAEHIVAPARKPHNEIALQQTPGGCGTPPFEWGGVQMQVRVDGPDLVVERDGDEQRAPLTTLAAAAEPVGADLFPDGVPEDATPLDIDPGDARQLGAYFAFSDEVLEELRAGMDEEMEASAINLWPEHFDIAFEAGSEAAGLRANYGASPGDENHPEPYLYVGPWTAKVEGELWRASGFNGAEVAHAELVAAGDQHAAALEFFRSRLKALQELRAD